MRRMAVVAVAVLALGWSGCKEKGEESPSTIVFPSSGVSYKTSVQPLFNQACALASCHDDGTHTSDLDLTSYSKLMFKISGIVVAGDPDASTLVLRIQGSVGTRMPPNANMLNDNQINGIRTWINEGAKNN